MILIHKMNKRNIMNFSFLSFGFFLFILQVVNCEDEYSRKADKPAVNPDCPPSLCKDKNINIVYIRSASKKDVLHILYGGGLFTSTPSVVIAKSTDLKSKLSINWTDLISNDTEQRINAIRFTNSNSEVGYYGMVFTKLYEYEDKDNKINLSNEKMYEWNFDDFQWDLVNKSIIEMGSFTFRATQFYNHDVKYHSLFSRNGTIDLRFSYSEIVTYNKNMPHLTFDSNNTQFDFVLNNLATTNLTIPRFAVQIGLINGYFTKLMQINTIVSIDDEWSPGVFKTVNFHGQNISEDFSKKTYVQWKPVCYTDPKDRSLNSMSVAKQFDLMVFTDDKNVSTVIKNSIAYLVLGDRIFYPNTSMSFVNITFGLANDKGYNNYIIWSGGFGVGVPPQYTLSITIIMIIAFGLGLPFLIVVFGSIYLLVKRRMRRSTMKSYVEIDEHIN